MKLVVKNNLGQTVSLQIRPEDTFIDLKERVEDEAGISLDLNDIATNGKKIVETQKVVDYFRNQTPEDDSIEEEADVVCAVPGCGNSRITTPEKGFFEFPQFPQEEIRCHQWVLYCQRLSMASGKHKMNLTQNSAICSDHFRSDQFIKNTMLLKRTAVPCINPELLTVGECITPALQKPPTTPVVNNVVNTAKPSRCRLCAQMTTDYVYIYSPEGRKMSLPEKINACLPIKVEMTDDLPKQICKSCIEELNTVSSYAEVVTNSEIELQKLTDSGFFKFDESSSVELLLKDIVDRTKRINVNDCLNTLQKDKNLPCPLCVEGEVSGQEQQPTSSSSSSSQEQDPLSIPPINSLEMTEEALNAHAIKEESLDLSDYYADAGKSEGLSSIEEEVGIDGDESEGAWSMGNSSTQLEDDNGAFICRICDQEYVELNEFVKHRLTHATSSLYHCPSCENYYDSVEELESHVIMMHKQGIPKDTDVTVHCQSCRQTFKSFLLLANHSCESMSPSTNKCNVCLKTFRSRGRLDFHMKFHSGAKPGYCDICKKSFPDEVKLYKHTVYLHASDKSHHCEVCGKVFRSQSALKFHQQSHMGEHFMRPFACDWCGKCFIRKSMLKNHITSTHKNLAQEASCFTCKICNECFPSTYVAVAHMDAKHKEECMDDNTYSFEMHTLTKVFLCEYCERCFAESTLINNHRHTHSSDMPYECKYCLETFQSFAEHNQHKNSHVDREIPIEYGASFSIPLHYLCEYCDRCFMNYIKYSEHLTIHYRPEPYECRFCNVRFKTLEEATEHRTTHPDNASVEEGNNYRPYECHYCTKTFAIEDALKKHIRMHTGEKPFICDQCGKGFSQSSGLYTHQKVHSDARPYPCHLCNRTFKIKGDRDVHVRKHSGDRPYKCEFCGKAFMTQHVYSQHRKIHTGERPYKCDVCGFAFRRSHVLTVHKRIHTGEKPNVCDICGKSYRQKGDMLKHRRVEHGYIKPLISA